jgi:hypothetical protein
MLSDGPWFYSGPVDSHQLHLDHRDWSTHNGRACGWDHTPNQQQAPSSLLELVQQLNKLAPDRSAGTHLPPLHPPEPQGARGNMEGVAACAAPAAKDRQLRPHV